VKPLVMDLGMHNGDDTAAYLAQGYRVVAVDADPEHIANARKRFKRELAKGDLVLEHCGITATAGEREFYRSRKITQWSSFDLGLANRNGAAYDAFTVPCRTPQSLFEQYGVPRYLKVDLEGNDQIVVAALAGLTERPRFLSVELMVVANIDAVAALGYREFCVVDQSAFMAKGNPSGPFGDAITEWYGADEAARRYSEGRRDPLKWFDLHAR
jgi:FkbM family methyltransferase